MLKEKIRSRQDGILLYGLTPPKQKRAPEKVKETAQKQIKRIEALDIDGLILYDLQDEAERSPEERPFPFLTTIDPSTYNKDYLSALKVPKILYRCVGKYTDAEMQQWLLDNRETDNCSVFVGAASRKQSIQMSMNRAYALMKELNPDLVLGGVTIPERHSKKDDEHLRIQKKIDQGCNFFVSQAVYDVVAAKNLLADYAYKALEQEKETVPIMLTMTPCGTLKTLQFMKWLGIHIPKWVENDLKYSDDMLNKSVALSRDFFQELYEYGQEKGIPIGCNVESVAIRKEEIEASIQLLNDIQKITGRKSGDANHGTSTL